MIWLIVSTRWRFLLPVLTGRYRAIRILLNIRGSQVNIKTGLKIDGVKNFHGHLVDFIEENGRKVIVVEVSGKNYRIPKAEIIKANLADNG